MAERDPNREPSEHYVPVELTKSAKASEKDVERIRKLSGQAKKTAESIARRKRQNARALKGSY